MFLLFYCDIKAIIALNFKIPYPYLTVPCYYRLKEKNGKAATKIESGTENPTRKPKHSFLSVQFSDGVSEYTYLNLIAVNAFE